MIHQAPGMPPVPCLRESHGHCAICERIDRNGPNYSEPYRRLFHPEEFPEEPPAVVSTPETPPQPAVPCPEAGPQPVPMPTEWLAQVPLAEGKPCCGGQPPGLLVKAANFAKAAFEHVKAGSPEADESTASARLGICLGCEHLNAHAMTCNLCGCSMPRKVYWLEQHCPIEKW
jgi:hypothetical protein